MNLQTLWMPQSTVFIFTLPQRDRSQFNWGYLLAWYWYAQERPCLPIETHKEHFFFKKKIPSASFPTRAQRGLSFAWRGEEEGFWVEIKAIHNGKHSYATLKFIFAPFMPTYLLFKRITLNHIAHATIYYQQFISHILNTKRTMDTHKQRNTHSATRLQPARNTQHTIHTTRNTQHSTTRNTQ